MNLAFNVNGLTVDAVYTESEVNALFLPLLKQLKDLYAGKGSRVIVYLAAPPGTGKTTLTLFLKYLHDQHDFPYTFQAISIDGFHHKRQYLMNTWISVDGEEMPLNSVKGSPESFDLAGLKQRIEELAEKETVEWPVYDRKLHDVSEEMVQVAADIVLVEGNYLLLNEPGWTELKDTADLTIFIEAAEETLKPRLVERKMMGGLPKDQAEAFYKQSDRRNVLRVLKHFSGSDICWKTTADRTLLRKI